MSHHEVIERYYRCYRERDLAELQEILTPDFHRVSSFGDYFSRDQMLDVIWPDVGRSWARNLEILGESPELLARYEIESPDRPVTRMAEYVRFKGERIAEIEVYIAGAANLRRQRLFATIRPVAVALYVSTGR